MLSAPIKVFIKPLIIWLWIGGSLMVFGTLLSAFPGKRRRLPTQPTSAPVPLDDDDDDDDDDIAELDPKVTVVETADVANV